MAYSLVVSFFSFNGEMDPIWNVNNMFQMGWFKPPTSLWHLWPFRYKYRAPDPNSYASGCVGCGYQWCTVVVEKTSHLVGILSKGADAAWGGYYWPVDMSRNFIAWNLNETNLRFQNKEVVLVGDVLHLFLFSSWCVREIWRSFRVAVPYCRGFSRLTGD